MTVWGHHVLLGLAVAVVSGIGLRLAAKLVEEGILRALVAGVFGCALVVLHALALGLVGLGGSAPALALAAGATWLVIVRFVPAPQPAVREQLAAWWARAKPPRRAWAGAAALLFAGWAIWQLRHPWVTTDGLVYHLALPGRWVHEGSPGSVAQVIAEVPFGNYPLTNELILSWALSLSRSWVVASIWTPTLAALLGLAAWVGLRELSVPPRQAGLAVAALLTLPLTVSQLGGPLTDLAALAWLVTCAALCAASLRAPAHPDGRPGLLVPALVAAGLAFGTKTTPALLLAIVLGATIWHHRVALQSLAPRLALAGVAAFGVGGIWAVRNLIEHGSPLWPFVSSSFGTPVPPRLAEIDDSFLDHPGLMLDGRIDDYLLLLAGAAVLLAAGLVLPLLRRSRASLAAGAVALLAMLAWASAPYTGIAQSTDLAIGATRYLLPAIAAATLALCLSARGGSRTVRGLATACLVAAIVVSLGRLRSVGFPVRPSTGDLLAMVFVGAAGGLLAGRLVLRLPRPRWSAPALVLVAGAALAMPASGYVARHATTGVGDGKLLRALAAQPGFEQSGHDVAMGPGTIALAAGDRLRHPVPLIEEDESCASLRARRRRGWVVLQRQPPTDIYRRFAGCMRGADPVWQDKAYELYSRLP